MEQLNGVYSDDQDPYEINMIALISNREEMDASYPADLKRRIQEFKVNQINVTHII